MIKKAAAATGLTVLLLLILLIVTSKGTKKGIANLSILNKSPGGGGNASGSNNYGGGNNATGASGWDTAQLALYNVIPANDGVNKWQYTDPDNVTWYGEPTDLINAYLQDHKTP